MSSYIWYEKYLPHSFEEMDLPKTTVQALNKYVEDKDIPNLLFYGPPGSGKCLGKGTPILMYDGSIKKVEEIVKGDLLMGPDSKHRTVLSTAKGINKLYKVSPVKGDVFIANGPHILSLQNTNTDKKVNVSINDYIHKSNNFKHEYKIWRTGVEFKGQPTKTKISPYILGVWLGDGTCKRPAISNPDKEIINEIYSFANELGVGVREQLDTENGKCPIYFFSNGRTGGKPNPFLEELKKLNLIENKHIPEQFKINNRKIRLEILAGLLDTDGFYDRGGYQFSSKYRRLADDVAFIARSLGLAAYVRSSQKKAQGWEESRTYYGVSISGDCSVIPCRVTRKKSKPREQIKSVLRTGFEIVPIGIGKYFGFELDKDGLFLLGDFTVTHNTTCAKILLDKIPNQSLRLNASNDRSMEVMRNQVVNFANSQPLPGQVKIVFMDEADGLLKASQDLLRGVIGVNKPCKFIFTANYPNKFSDPIRSRFISIQFKTVKKETLIKHLTKILSAEKIKFSLKDLTTVFDLYFPDIRTMVNALQLCSVGGAVDLSHLQEIEDRASFLEISNAIKMGEIGKVRELSVGVHDFQGHYKFLYDEFMYSIPEKARPSVAVTIADYLYKDNIVIDKEINFSALCVELMDILGLKSIKW